MSLEQNALKLRAILQTMLDNTEFRQGWAGGDNQAWFTVDGKEYRYEQKQGSATWYLAEVGGKLFRHLQKGVFVYSFTENHVNMMLCAHVNGAPVQVMQSLSWLMLRHHNDLPRVVEHIIKEASSLLGAIIIDHLNLEVL